MPDRLHKILPLCLLAGLGMAVYASAAQIPQPTPAAAEPAPTEIQAAPEPPKAVVSVEITDNLLTVDFENTDFSSAIKAVAEKAGFKVEGAGDVFSRKLNTKFSNIDIDRGVMRMLTLVKESNYTLHYDTSGAISKLEILGSVAASSPATTPKQQVRSVQSLRQTTPAAAPAQQPASRPALSPASPPVAPPAQARGPRSSRRLMPATMVRPTRQVAPVRAGTQPLKPAESQSAAEVSDENNEEKNSEEPVEEIPYTPQQPPPAFVPKNR